MRIILRCCLLCILMTLAGCRSFMAVSFSKFSDGGVYRVSNGKTEQLIRLPNLNYLIHDSKTDFYYGTISRQIDRNDGTGAVVTLKKSSVKSMEPMQIANTGGKTPCCLTLSPDRCFLYAVNYSSGDISEFRLRNGLCCCPARLIRHSGHGKTSRQRMPHPHFSAFDPTEKQLYVCDLGTDQIWIYDWSPEKGVILPCAEKLQLPPGSGPRHLVFDPSGSILYCVNELNSTVASFFRKGPEEPWHRMKICSTLTEPLRQQSGNYPGAIKITGDGRFILAANRGHDSIALFETLGGGEFRLIRTVPSQGKFPSDILLLGKDKFAAVSHLRSGTVTVFRFDGKKRELIPSSDPQTIPHAMGLCSGF